MKAIGARQFLPVSDPDCLIEFEAEKPGPGPLDLLVRVCAHAVMETGSAHGKWVLTQFQI